jgi:septal ring factor EnvC (AmiA/AmiB activator)
MIYSLQKNNSYFFKDQYSIIFLIIFLSAIILIPSDVLASSRGQLKQQQLIQLQHYIHKLTQQLERQYSEKTQLDQNVKEIEKKISDKAQQLLLIQKKIEKLTFKLLQLNENVFNNQQQLLIQQQLLAGQLQASYAMGRQEYIKLLLNQQNPAIISRIMTYYDYFNVARSQKIEQVTLLLHQIDQDKQQVNVMSARRRDEHEQLIIERKALQQQQTKHLLVVTQLEQQIFSKNMYLTRLLVDKKNLQQLITQLKKALDDIPELAIEKSFAQQQGKLTWPAKGQIKKLFNHWRTVDKVKWQGNLIRGEEGTPIYAIANGRVAYADWLRGYGLITIIDHSDGYMSLYAHNQTLLNEVGDWVEDNQMIATMGRSGGLKQVALYFEIRHDGKPSNPSLWCKKQLR